MTYFKCVSDSEGPVLACFLIMKKDKIFLRWGPSQKKKPCWFHCWPKGSLFVLDEKDPLLFHESMDMYENFMSEDDFSKKEIRYVHSDDICHFIPISDKDEIGSRRKYYFVENILY